MANLATQSIDLDGLDATYSACAGGGDTFTPNGRTFLHIKNGHTSPQTVTIDTPGTELGLAIANPSVAVTNADEAFIGPFPAEHFASPTTGLASISYSGVTALTIAVIEVSQPAQ